MKTLKLGNTFKVIDLQHESDFSDWLNLVDARHDYDERRDLGPVEYWRDLFLDGHSPDEAWDYALRANEHRTDDRFSGGPGSLVDETYEHDDQPDESMDGDHDSAMASAGFGTDEDYGCYGNTSSDEF